MQELSLSSTTSISFPNGKDDLLTFIITLKPDDGFWKGGTYPFLFKIPPQYPHQPPKVHCETKVGEWFVRRPSA
jgi:ubiquitin-conjugating enzyme E2 M